VLNTLGAGDLTHSVRQAEEFGRSNLRSLSQLYDVEKADVPFRALYPTHTVPMQISRLRQLLLRRRDGPRQVSLLSRLKLAKRRRRC
jgi:hypothetical protein